MHPKKFRIKIFAYQLYADFVVSSIDSPLDIENAIVDQNARIGRNVRIQSQAGKENYDSENFSIRDGIAVIHRNGVIPDNTVI